MVHQQNSPHQAPVSSPASPFGGNRHVRLKEEYYTTEQTESGQTIHNPGHKGGIHQHRHQLVTQ